MQGYLDVIALTVGAVVGVVILRIIHGCWFWEVVNSG